MPDMTVMRTTLYAQCSRLSASPVQHLATVAVLAVHNALLPREKLEVFCLILHVLRSTKSPLRAAKDSSRVDHQG